jgi:hypothetical protein
LPGALGEHSFHLGKRDAAHLQQHQQVIEEIGRLGDQPAAGGGGGGGRAAPPPPPPTKGDSLVHRGCRPRHFGYFIDFIDFIARTT